MPLLIFRAAREQVRLEEDLRRLERDFKALELEWGDVYDKLRKAMGRIVKSRAIIEAREDGREGAEAPVPEAQPSSSGHLLTPRQMTIQQQILKRRAGL